MVLELEVANGELLVAHVCPYCTSLEFEVGHEPAGAVFHVDALLVVAGDGGHDEFDVLEGGGLSDLPVETCDVGNFGSGGDVDDEVADLSEEVALESLLVSLGP